MAFSYRQVKDLYDVLKDSGVTTAELPDWATEMNALSNSDIYSAGLEDNFVKRASVGIDRLLEATGLPTATEEFGRGVGGLVGNEEVGAAIGHSMPRMALNFLPFLIPGVGWGAGVARLGGAAALAGAESYTSTGSPAAGLLTAGTTAALPGLTNAVEQAVLRRLGGRAVSGPLAMGDDLTNITQVNRVFPTTVGQGVTSQLAGQGAAAIATEGSSFGQEALAGQPLHNPFSTETLLNLTLGQVPFAGIYATKGGKAALGGETSRKTADALEQAISTTKNKLEFSQAQEALKNKTPIETIPDFTGERNVGVVADNNLRIQQLRQRQRELKNEPTTLNIEEWNKLSQEENKLISEQGERPNRIAGVSIEGGTPRRPVSGREVFRNKEGTFRLVDVANEEANGDLAGKLIGYSTLNEPQSEAGMYNLPEGFFSEFSRRPTTPDLPIQPQPNERPFDHVIALQEAETALQSAESPAELQSALVKLNGVREANSLPPLTDGQLRRRAAILREVDPKKVAVGEIKRTQRQIDRVEEIRLADVYRAEQVVRSQSDEGIANELTQLAELEKSISLKGGKHADQLLGGDLNRLYRQWAEGGREGSWEAFSNRVLESAKTGKGLSEASTKGVLGKVVELPKDADTQPIRDVMADYAIAALDDPIARKVWEQWEGKGKNPFDIEQARFAVLYGELGHTLWTKPIKGEDAQDVNQILAENGLEFDDTAELLTFKDRPHVNAWKLATERGQLEGAKHAPARTNKPAGGGFVWGLELFDPQTRKLGKHTLPRDNKLRVSQFKNMGGRGKPLPDVEIELAKVVVPEAFDEAGNVDVKKLFEGLDEKGPTLEVKKLGEGGGMRGPEQAIHELETLGYEVNRNEGFEVLDSTGNLVTSSTNPRVRELLNQLNEVAESPESAGRYSFLGPKPEAEMPGYVEGLVRVPKEMTKSGREWDLPEYRGPHFSSEDTNVLAFFRGYEETLPNGQKAFHVIEVQSDWGQRIREESKGQTYGEDDIPNAVNRPDLAAPKTTSQPLLPVYETLALKAAITHAREIGADVIVLSDAETAMMTEGHDRQLLLHNFKLESKNGKHRQVSLVGGETSPWFHSIEEADAWALQNNPSRPPQEQGMRLHYDQTLPSALAKLTGGRGAPVELGQHKMTQEPEQFTGAVPAGSTVFRDSSGQPKTQITGRAFPLQFAFANIDLQGGLTVADPNRAARPFVPEVPEDVSVVTSVGRNGRSLGQFLENSTDPFVSAFMKDVKGRVGSLLDRIAVQFVSGEQTSKAQRTAWNRAQISLADSALRLPEEYRDREFLHELVHGLTLNALHDPDPQTRAKVTELNSFREQLINGLPSQLKERLTTAQKSNWYTRYSRGLAKIDELSSNPTEQQVLYGLLNNDEFVTQGFSSNEFRSYLRTKKMAGGSAFKKFVNWVKTMVGYGENVKDTAFEAFLGHVDGIFMQGEYIARLDNFAERYLEGRGIEGHLVKPQAQRATAIAKIAAYGTSAGEIFDFLSIPQAFKSTQLAKATRDLDKALPTDEGLRAVMIELEHDPSRNGVDDLLINMLRGEVPDDALDVLPGSATRYLYSRLDDMRQVLDVVRAATNTKGLVNLTDSTGLKPPVEVAIKQIDRLLKARKFEEETRQAISQLETSIAPDGFLDSVLQTESTSSPALRTFLGDLKEEGDKGISWLSRFLKPPSQMARENPETAEGIGRGYELQANARKMASEGLKVFGLDTDNPTSGLSHDSVQRLSKALSSPKIEHAVHKWIFANQKAGKNSGSTVLLPDSNPEVQKALVGLTPQEKADVVDVVAKVQVSQQMMQAQVVEKMEQIAVTNGATLLGRHTGLKVAQNLAVSEAVLKAVQTDFTDPIAAQRAQSELAQVQQKISPEAFRAVLQHTQLENEKITGWKQHFAANPGWVSGQRYGKLLVRFTNGEVLGVNSKAEARSEAKKYGFTIADISPNRASEDDAPPVLGPEADKLFARLRELETNQIEMLEANGVPPEEIEAIRRTSPVAQFERETVARQGVPGVVPPPRGLTRGADKLPWLSNHFSWVQKASTYWSRQLFRAQTRAHLLESEIAQNPELQGWMKTHFDNILHQDPESVQKFKRFMTTWFLGYNPASVLVNAAQPFTTHVAEFTAMTGKPLDSYRRVTKALSEIAGHFAGGKDWATKEHSLLMKEAVEALEVGYGKFDDEAAAQESIATNYKRILAGNKPQTLGQRLSSLAGAYSNVGMWLFQQGEQVNNRAALLAAFDYYRESGMTYEQAKAKAFEFNRAVNFGGGRANRPVGAFSGRGAFPRGTAMLGTALQSYVLGTTFQLIRYLKQGFFRPSGLTPAESYAAKKAGVQLLATQFAAAGLLGLPFVSGAIALLDKAFPELELNRKMREGLDGLLSSDEENGSLLSDIAMTGVPSMFGWDLQSRLSMGNTVPGVSEINGFQPEQLFGPSASLVSNFVNGTKKLLRGDTNGALSFVPPAVRKLAELVKEEGQIQDYRGRPVFDPTGGEKLGIALGFNPKRLSDFNAASRISEQQETVARRREGQFRQSLAEEVLRGNFGNVKSQLLQRAQQDKNYDVREAIRAVARSAEELTYPRDLRREGSARISDVRSRLLQTFNLPPSVANEEQRLRFRLQVEQRLGLMEQPSSREIAIAQLVDEGRAHNPEMSRSELRRNAERLLRRRTESPLVLQ